MLDRLNRWSRGFEDTVLVLLLVALIGFSSGQIFLRNVLAIGVPWIDELLRLLVLWLALWASVVATRYDKHIAIDVLSRFLAPTPLRWVKALTTLFSAVVCGALAFHGYRFVSESREFEDTLFGSLPAWPFQVIIPLAFGLMTYRFTIRLMQLLRPQVAT